MKSLAIRQIGRNQWAIVADGVDISDKVTSVTVQFNAGDRALVSVDWADVEDLDVVVVDI